MSDESTPRSVVKDFFALANVARIVRDACAKHLKTVGPGGTQAMLSRTHTVLSDLIVQADLLESWLAESKALGRHLETAAQ